MPKEKLPQTLQHALNQLSEPTPRDVAKLFLDYKQHFINQYLQIHSPITASYIIPTYIIQSYAELMDVLLRFVWHNTIGNDQNFSLYAVGGYGRRHLFLESDIDIWIIAKYTPTPAQQHDIQQFLNQLWDSKLTLGCKVCTLAEAIEDINQEIEVYTHCLERRLLSPHSAFSAQIEQAIAHLAWEDESFFLAKCTEQKQRHHKYGDSAYLLEPSIKHSPGNLRDLHLIHWLCLHFFQQQDLKALVDANMLAEEDYIILQQCENFLSHIRWYLHQLTGHKDERLYFDLQIKVAEGLAYTANTTNASVEQLMKDYYRHVKEVRALNEIIIQSFQQRMNIASTASMKPLKLGAFTSTAQTLHLPESLSLQRHPELIMELFLIFAKYQTIQQFSASTIKALRQNHYRLQSLNAKQRRQTARYFMGIFQYPSKIEPCLRLMNRYNVLGSYLQDFDHVIGLSQFDRFHIYTVDEHTLQVIKHIDEYFITEQPTLIQHIVHEAHFQTKLLYLAALFHDIGKGRGTDHSEYGATVARVFAQQHHLTELEADTLCWLVNHHLLLSQTAQRKNIQDPHVIQHFTQQVASLPRLQYLYLLTIADVKGTNPSLWNDWKASLFQQLYVASKACFANPQRLAADNDLPEDTLNQIKQRLAASATIDSALANSLLDIIQHHFFAEESSANLAWLVDGIIEHSCWQQPLVTLRCQPEHGVTQLLVCTKDTELLFARIIATLERLRISVVEAKIHTSQFGYCVDILQILDVNQQAIQTSSMFVTIQQQLVDNLMLKQSLSLSYQCYQPKYTQTFRGKTTVNLMNHPNMQLTELIINTADRFGLLACIARALAKLNIRIHEARIITLGERVDDIFMITDYNHRPITERKHQQKIQRELISAIDIAT